MRKRRNAVIILFLVLLGCKGNADDRSLTLQKYYDEGVPSVEGQWKTKEVSRALEILLKMKKRSFFVLPRKSSERSKLIYEKLISGDNIIDYSNKAEMSQVLLNLLNLYNDDNFSRRPGFYHEEETGMLIYYLKLITKSRNDLPIINRNDSTTQIEMMKIENGFTMVISGSLFYQNDTIHLTQQDRISLSEEIYRSVENEWKTLSDVSKDRLKRELDSAVRLNSDKEVKERYAQFLNRLN